MNELTDRPSAEHQHAVTRNEGPGTRWGRQHVKGVALIRLIAAAWMVILGSIFCASGHWWGALFFPAAALLAWLAYQLPRSKRARPAGRNVTRPR